MILLLVVNSTSEVFSFKSARWFLALAVCVAEGWPVDGRFLLNCRRLFAGCLIDVYSLLFSGRCLIDVGWFRLFYCRLFAGGDIPIKLKIKMNVYFFNILPASCGGTGGIYAVRKTLTAHRRSPAIVLPSPLLH